MMISPGFKINLASLALVCLAVGLSNGQQVGAGDALGGLGNLIGGVSHAVNDLTGGALSGSANGLGVGLSGGVGGSAGQGGLLGGVLPNVLNSAGSMVNGVTRPVMGLLGSLTGGAGGPLGMSGNNLIGDTMRLYTGALNGLTSGLTAGAGFAGPGGSALAGNPNLGPASGLHNAYKREAAAAAAAGNMMGPGVQDSAETGAIEAGAHYGAATSGLGPAATISAAESANLGAASAVGHMVSNAAINSGIENAVAANSLGAQNTGVANVAANQVAAGRAGLASEALRNAQGESALAGADMVAHGANNARSASLASNAYRQAKLASARDRVNIAGTIQNSARISDAAIATHDAATRAEDSLMGSELAVDSASTVLDSDGAYIPPVTSSLLRSLPYGRLGVRNIIPKPLTYPSVLLPDVWLNGVPVNYLNVPLRMLPYTIGSTAQTNPLWSSGQALANGQIINGQPFIANNGKLLNGMVIDPAVAYMSSGLAGVNGLASSSVLPVLANGQLEAQDEVAAANLVTMQQLGGAGMSGTYHGYGRLNPVPMITGSVSDVNLLPTTTVGTTYPIGSALVIEPRDSFFQDYVDNASSRQNFDEREQ